MIRYLSFIVLALTAVLLAAPNVSGATAAGPVPRPVAPDPEPEGNPGIPRIAFTSFAADAPALTSALVLAESIRQFGGRWRDAPFYLYLDASRLHPDEPTAVRLAAANVTLAAVTVPPDAAAFPYAGKAFAAAEAERDLAPHCDLLARMDPDTLVLKEPSALALAPGLAVGYVPVHQVLIASPVASPPDAFWSVVYRALGIPPSSAFPVTTIVDATTVRAYFNAGLMVVRPERHVFRAWRDGFVQLLRNARIREMTRQDQGRRMFLHQVALAAAVLQSTPPAQAVRLPDTYNYPLALYRDPDALDRFVTVRYENLLTSVGWTSRLRASEPLLAWLRARFPQ